MALKAFAWYILFTLLLYVPARAQQADTALTAIKLQPVEGTRFMDTLDQDTLFALYQQSFYHVDTTRIADSTAFYRPARSDIHLRSQQQRPWVFYMFAGMLLIVALLRVTQTQVAYNYWDFLVYPSLTEEADLSSGGQGLIFARFFTVHVLMLGFAIHLWYSRYSGGNADLDAILYLKITGVTALVYLVKYLMYGLIAWTLNLQRMTLAIVQSSSVINYLFSLALIPLLLLIYYTSIKELATFAYLALVILSMLYIGVRIFRGVVMHSGLFPYSVFHLFVYLCTFEIIPLLIIIKLIINKVG